MPSIIERGEEKDNGGEGIDLSPVSPKGEKPRPLEMGLCLGNSTCRQRRKEVNSVPSPLGEGQTDMPINRRYLGEVCLDGNTTIGG